MIFACKNHSEHDYDYQTDIRSISDSAHIFTVILFEIVNTQRDILKALIFSLSVFIHLSYLYNVLP